MCKRQRTFAAFTVHGTMLVCFTISNDIHIFRLVQFACIDLWLSTYTNTTNISLFVEFFIWRRRYICPYFDGVNIAQGIAILTCRNNRVIIFLDCGSIIFSINFHSKLWSLKFIFPIVHIWNCIAFCRR